jgi:HEAT repeat protein
MQPSAGEAPKRDPETSVTESKIESDQELTAPPASPAELLKVGEIFADRYEIKGELGRGGFGVVYSAFDRGPLQRTVALKVIRLAWGQTSEHAALARKRFLEEARVAGNLSHSNIAAVFDVGESAECVYMTQELAPGRDLRKILAETGALPLRRIVAITRQICEGLAHAHGRGIVHRDIKPGNIVVGSEDRVKVTDFGLAQPHQGEDSALNQAVAGTPGYMSPEQLRGERVDGRADIFAIGCVLYQMLTGRQPFEGATVASIMDKTLHAFPPDPSQVREDLPRTLDRIVARAMRKDPAERYHNTTQLQQDLLNYDQFDYLTEAKAGAAEIAGALEARQCTLFLGLRLPVSLSEKHAPTAEALIADFLAERLNSPSTQRSLARLAQELELERGRPEMLKSLTAAIRNPRASPREMIRRVARLPFPVIVTTGYDTVLEEELAKVSRKVRRVINCRSVPDDPADADLLVRLFGSVDSEASIVVTEDDLWNFFGSFHSLSDALKSLFARHRLLFVGYDPEDEGFRHLFSEIARFRAGSTEACYLAAPDMALPAVRWAQRKSLRLIDTEPASFLSLIEETATERRRQKRSANEVPSEAPLPSRPYKFLNYYDREDERIFFGRQSETNRLLTKIHAYPLNVLYASSGSGKTSLICAGLMPQLRRQGYTPVYCRVYDDPAGEIGRAALDAVGSSASDFPAAMPLQALLPELAARSEQRLVIFVDQFEEIFIRHDHEARDRFAASLAATLVEGKGRVRFVLSMREDFLARLSEFRERIPNIFHNEFRLAPLSDAESRAAIVEPARLLGLTVEPELVERLIADLSREGVDPPQLQIVCDTLYDALEHGEKRLTLKSYLALGETRKILGNYLERVLHEFSPPERDAARELLKSLVTSEKTKTVAQIADLARAAGRPEDEASKILGDLSNRRLIRRVQREEGYWYELTHEYLVEEISRWLSAKEMQRKKLRELLEQAIRNRRNLGILMPASQLRLVQSQEEDLNLSKEERQFLRESAQALSTRRRQMGISAAVAAVLLLALGVMARYFYLSSHAFAQSEDREYISYGSDFSAADKQGYRLEEIRVYKGSPARWWLDSRLGFPRELYQTDFDLEEVDPSYRDTLKSGVMLDGATSVDDQIATMLLPDAQVRFLATSGRPEQAEILLRKLYADRSVDQATLDGLAGLLAYSGVHDSELVSAAIRHAFRPESTFNPFDIGTLNLVPLLEGDRDIGWRSQVIRYLGIPASRSGALRLLGAVGTSDDARLIRPFLASSYGGDDGEGSFGTRATAIRALLGVGECSSIDSVRQLLIRGGTDPTAGPLDYLRWCGNRSDLALLGRVASRQISSVSSTPYPFQLTLATMYQVAGRSAIPIIKGIVAGLPPNNWKIESEEGIFEPELTSDLRSALTSPQPIVRAIAANALAKRGDPSGLEYAATTALDPKQEIQTRFVALRALRWVKDPMIERFLFGLAKPAVGAHAEVRAAAYEGLWWYDDEEALNLLVDGLGDQFRWVRSSAVSSLAFWSSPAVKKFLAARLRTLDPVRKVYAARALQLMGPGVYPEVFSSFLKSQADELKDYNATVEAIEGLRDAYLLEPVITVIAALRDERREVRLAATLALAGHSNPQDTKNALIKASADKDPYFRTAVARALWAFAVVQRAKAGRAKAADLFAKNELHGAQLALNRAHHSDFGIGIRFERPPDDTTMLEAGLSVAKSSKVRSGITRSSIIFDDAFRSEGDEFNRLACEINAATGDTETALNRVTSLAMDGPGARKSLAEDPLLAPLRNIYQFQVLTGMRPPIAVENFKPPQSAPQLPQAALKKSS